MDKNREMRFASSKEEAKEFCVNILQKYHDAYKSKNGDTFDILGFIDEVYESELYSQLKIEPIILHHGNSLKSIAIYTLYKPIADKYGILDGTKTYKFFHGLHRTHLLNDTPTSTQDEILWGSIINTEFGEMSDEDAVLFAIYGNIHPKKVDELKVEKLLKYFRQYKHLLKNSIQFYNNKFKKGMRAYKAPQSKKLLPEYVKCRKKYQSSASPSKEAKTDLYIIDKNMNNIFNISIKKNFTARTESSNGYTFLSMVESALTIPQNIKNLWDEFRELVLHSTYIKGINMTELKVKNLEQYNKIRQEYHDGTALLKQMYEINPEFKYAINRLSVDGTYKFYAGDNSIPTMMFIYSSAYSILFFDNIDNYMEEHGKNIKSVCNSKSRSPEIQLHVHLSCS